MEDNILADQDTQIGDSTWIRYGSELRNAVDSQHPANSCAQWRLDTHSCRRTNPHTGAHGRSDNYCFKAPLPNTGINASRLTALAILGLLTGAAVLHYRRKITS